jgi:hypothetical protein
MNLVWTVFLVVIAIVIFLLSSAVLELHRGLEQVRQQSGVIDSPVSLDIDLPRPLPASGSLPPEIFDQDRALLLVLSDHCSTCTIIAEHLGGALPPSTWLLVTPQSPEAARDWLSRYGFAAGSRVIVDERAALSRAAGVTISPAVLRVRKGTVVAAHTLPSARRLEDEVAWLGNGKGAGRADNPRPATGEDVEAMS